MNRRTLLAILLAACAAPAAHGQAWPNRSVTLVVLRDWLKSEIDKWGPVIRSAGTFAD